jgi:hypothetical protein
MANEKNRLLQDFLDANPEFKGKFHGYQHQQPENRRWFSRINDGWHECDDYFIEISDLIEVLEEYNKKLNQ